MTHRRDLLLRSALLAATGLLATPAQADTAWNPDRALRIVVPVAPGGSLDILGRLLARHLTEALGQNVVTENKPGAGSNIAFELVARAAPDGLTLLVGSDPLTINPALYPRVGFDPVRDFSPVIEAVRAPQVLVVHPSAPVRDVAGFIAWARQADGKLTLASQGNGSIGHLAGALFAQDAGLGFTHVPYRGGGPQMLALVAGEHDFGFSPMGTVLTHVQAGTIRALGVATKIRARELPDVPSMIEAGLPDFEVLNWDGFVLPAGTPAPIRARLGEVIRAALAEPSVIADFQRRGLEAWPSTEAAFAAQLAADAAKWQPLIRAAGIEPS